MIKDKLPEEIEQQLNDYSDNSRSVINAKYGAVITHKHYEPIITNLREENERLKGLLKEEHCYKVVGDLIAAGTSFDKIVAVETQMWKKYCQQNNIEL